MARRIAWPIVQSARGVTQSLCLLAELGAAIIQTRVARAYLPDALLLHFSIQASEQVAQRHGAQVAVDAIAHGNRAGGLLLLADNEHVRNLLELRLADLVADLLRPVIPFDAVAARLERSFQAPALVRKRLAHRQPPYVLRRQPERTRRGALPDQEPDATPTRA